MKHTSMKAYFACQSYGDDSHDENGDGDENGGGDEDTYVEDRSGGLSCPLKCQQIE